MPLLFNLCINILIPAIKNEKVSCLGYVYNISSSPRQWFQFAVDTAIVTADEGDNQLLCNVFSKRTSLTTKNHCQWRNNPSPNLCCAKH